MPESLLLFPSVVPTCGFCLQVQSRSRGVKKSRSWAANRRPHLSVRSLGRRWVIPGLPDSSISRPRNLASEPRRHDSEKHKNNTNEASILLKTQGAFGKRTQNELNFEHRMCGLRPKSELAGLSRVAPVRPHLREEAGFRIDPGTETGEGKYRNRGNKAKKSLKTKEEGFAQVSKGTSKIAKTDQTSSGLLRLTEERLNPWGC